MFVLLVRVHNYHCAVIILLDNASFHHVVQAFRSVSVALALLGGLGELLLQEFHANPEVFSLVDHVGILQFICGNLDLCSPTRNVGLKQINRRAISGYNNDRLEC